MHITDFRRHSCGTGSRRPVQDVADPRKIAQRALEILDRDGWARYYLTVPRNTPWAAGAHCVLGAWNLAAADVYPQPSLSLSSAATALVAAVGVGGIHEVTRWNDYRATESDVRAVLAGIAAGE